MKIYTKVVMDMETGQVLEGFSYEYEGPIEFFCGGPTQQQKDAATQTAALDKALAGQFTTGTAITNPFFSNLVTNPGQNPQLAQQYGMQKAGLAARDAGFGGALPSGFEAQQQLD